VVPDKVALLSGAQKVPREARFLEIIGIHEDIRSIQIHNYEPVILGLIEELEAPSEPFHVGPFLVGGGILGYGLKYG
jgi:hypothetical protein